MERDCQFMVAPPRQYEYDEACQFTHQLMVPAAGDDHHDPSGAGRGVAGGGERKRRFTEEQVRSLETTFHARRAKLEPREKAALARDLGLQPRQVAIWFQNKRARWRSKQLEHDYAALRARYDALHDRVESLRREKAALADQVDDLRKRLRLDHQSGGGSCCEANGAEAAGDGRDSTTASTVVAAQADDSATPPAVAVAVAAASEESAAATEYYDHDHVVAFDGLPEPFCAATPDLLWDTWPLLEWNAVA